MPRVRPIPDGFGVAQLIFTCTGDSRTPEITFGFTDDTGRSPNVIAGAIRTHWHTANSPANLSNVWTQSKCLVTVNRGGDLLDGIDGTVTAGGASETPVSLAVCILARKTTDLGGRANRGRCYWPAGYLPEAAVDAAGVILSADVTAYSGRWADFITAMDTDSLQMVLIHSGESGTVLPAPTPVTGGFVESMVATQRRRQRKVGRGRRAGP